jgi:hypothetical protein
MTKVPDLRIPPEAAAIMARMVRMPPKLHKEMKLSKRKAKAETKERPASKGRAHKGKSRT